jgi:1-phosphofructokinase family hexose kinase
LILTVTLNPAIDNYIKTDIFKPARLNRVEKVEKYPGGKGINISIMLGVLDLNVTATGFVGWSSSKYIQNVMSKQGVMTDFVLINEETRNNYLILDETPLPDTMLNEKGPIVSDFEINAFFNSFRKLVKRAKMVVLAGSLPLNIMPTIYCQLSEIAHEENVRVIINTQEENLIPTLQTRPYIIMPDTRGTDTILGKKIEDVKGLARLASQMLSQGARIAVLTTDELNFLVLTPEHCWECSPPSDIRVLNRFRSGDAMLAGMLYSIRRGNDLQEAIRWGTALSASMLSYRGPFIRSIEEVEKYLDMVNIREIYL